MSCVFPETSKTLNRIGHFKHFSPQFQNRSVSIQSSIQPLSRKMSTPNEPVKEFYSQDLVYKFDKQKRIQLGTVSETYEGSDNDEFPTLQKGQILVSWSNSGRKQICKQSKMHLMSRSIIPGDIVRRLEDGKETQRGYCKKTKQFATVQIVKSDKVIEHIPEGRLYFVKPLDIGDAVALGDKFGRIQDIDQMIRMQSKCGSIVEIRSSINFGVRDIWNNSKSRNYLGPAYPGQTVICTPMHLRDPKWLKKSNTMKRKMGTGQIFVIQNIEIVLVEVIWCKSSGYTEHAEIRGDKIRKLKVLSDCEHLAICDRYLLKLKPNDILLKKRDWIKKTSLQHLPKVPTEKKNVYTCIEPIDSDWYTEEEYQTDEEFGKIQVSKKKHCLPKLNKFSDGSIVAVEVLCTDSKATIVWQDGAEEKDIPTTELYYSVGLDDHEFFPGECVVPNASSEYSDKYGVVQKVNFSERTALIKWFSHSDLDQKPQELSTEELSVYDLKKHARYVFRPGSVVKVKPTVDDQIGKVIDSYPEGYVMVQWIDGKKENCWPHNLVYIPESDGLDFLDSFESDEDLSGSSSWETESIESFDGDVTDEIILQNMAAKVAFIRNRISYLSEAFRQHNINQNFHFLRDLLCVYHNSSYLDKYLGTTFFSLESQHFQALLLETKKNAESMGIKLQGRLFSGEMPLVNCIRNGEKENIEKMIQLENEVNAQIESNKDISAGDLCKLEQKCCPTTDSSDPVNNCHENLCIELLVMLKIRMDLVYAEIVSRIGDEQALTVLTNSSKDAMKPSPSAAALQNALLTPEPTTPPKLSQLMAVTPKINEAFTILEEAPTSHYYFAAKLEPKDLRRFLNALQKEYKLLKESLPPGVWVRTYNNRMDLLSVMIRGPAKTPYEDGLFLFDIQLSQDYPRNPPSVHYISYSSEALNPNLYVEGKVCVSLLGTWMGRGSEVWGPNSTLLQLIVSIQGLILVAEPYYNEAGYERQTNTQQGYENSRTYNEFVLLKLVQSMTELLNASPKVFEREVLLHFQENGEKMCDRLIAFCKDGAVKPEFPLVPVSKGLKLSLTSAVGVFREALRKALEKEAVF